MCPNALSWTHCLRDGVSELRGRTFDIRWCDPRNYTCRSSLETPVRVKLSKHAHLRGSAADRGIERERAAMISPDTFVAAICRGAGAELSFGFPLAGHRR